MGVRRPSFLSREGLSSWQWPQRRSQESSTWASVSHRAPGRVDSMLPAQDMVRE